MTKVGSCFSCHLYRFTISWVVTPLLTVTFTSSRSHITKSTFLTLVQPQDFSYFIQNENRDQKNFADETQFKLIEKNLKSWRFKNENDGCRVNEACKKLWAFGNKTKLVSKKLLMMLVFKARAVTLGGPTFDSQQFCH